MGLKKQLLKSKPLCKVTFSLPKEAVNGAKEVKVLGEFNNWDWAKATPMKKAKGSYTAVVELPTGKAYQFRYKADNYAWENDWAADDYIPSPYDGIDNSVVIVPETVAPRSVVKATAKSKAKPAKKAVAKTTTKRKVSRVTGADKLTKIEGIGPKIEKLLKADGIDTFAKLAKASQKTLKGILEAAGPRFKMHTPKTWPQQSKLAAAGQWDKLKTLQDKLNGGK